MEGKGKGGGAGARGRNGLKRDRENMREKGEGRVEDGQEKWGARWGGRIGGGVACSVLINSELFHRLHVVQKHQLRSQSKKIPATE